MTITLLVITDGRVDCLERTLASFEEYIGWDQVGDRVLVNDCPDRDFRRYVNRLSFDIHVAPQTRRRGFAGAIAAGWNVLDGRDEWVFHLEDDFVFTRPVDLAAMRSVLERRPHLAQMALRRQPWNDAERAAGGVVEQHPTDYADCTDGTHVWLEHRRFFTTNPSLYPAWVRRGGWPGVAQSEGIFSHQLFTDPQTACGFWGSRTDDPWVIHIGAERTGTGY
jgi:Glycosyl transferase family 2